LRKSAVSVSITAARRRAEAALVAAREVAHGRYRPPDQPAKHRNVIRVAEKRRVWSGGLAQRFANRLR
jgi:hypothetical protein